MVKLASYEPLEGSSCPPSPSSPRGRKKGCGACGGIPGARWLSKSFKEKKNGMTKRKADGFRTPRSNRKRGRDRVEVEAELKRESNMESDRDSDLGGLASDMGVAAYAGWVYHVGTSSLGYQFFTDRFLIIKGKHVTMFKRNPVEYPRAVCRRFSSVTLPCFVKFIPNGMHPCCWFMHLVQDELRPFWRTEWFRSVFPLYL